MKYFGFLLLCWFIFCDKHVNSTVKLQEEFSWKILDYAYPDENQRLRAILTGRFIPENNLPVGIEIWRDKLFVTVPRWRPGKNYYFLFYIFLYP